MCIRDRYYRRQVTSGITAPCNVAQTASVLVTVAPIFVVGSIAGTQTVCQTGNPANITSASLPTGGKTPYTYTWESSTDGGATWTAIAGATLVSYDPPAGIATTTQYRRIDISAGGCGSLTTAAITVTVTPTVVPTVTISANNSTICTGTSITFTAVPVNGGTPTYQWQKSINSGGTWTNIAAETNVTYVTTGAANNDQYRVVMTSTATCASPTVVNSNAITITVTSVVVPAVTIVAAPGNTICAGVSVTFTATPSNGGTLPTYQWKKGGTPIAAETNATYTTTTLANGDVISVDMVSNSGCASPTGASSPSITMTVNPNVVPSVTVLADKTTICPGDAVKFTATPVNGGTPTYQWRDASNTPIAGATNATYTTTSLTASNNSVTVVMTSTATCASPTTGTSAPTVITVNPALTPTVSLSLIHI
jgi:hypothetical protein